MVRPPLLASRELGPQNCGDQKCLLHRRRRIAVGVAWTGSVEPAVSQPADDLVGLPRHVAALVPPPVQHLPAVLVQQVYRLAIHPSTVPTKEPPVPWSIFAIDGRPATAPPRVGRPKRDRSKVKSGRKAARRN